MNTFIRLVPVIFACVVTQSFAADPTTPSPVDPTKATAPPATQSATAASTTSPTNPATAPAKTQQVVLDDKTLTQAEVNQLLSQGYKPQKGRGDSVLYCRRERTLGSRFDTKICLTGDQIKTRIQGNKDVKQSLDRNNINPQNKIGGGSF